MKRSIGLAVVAVGLLAAGCGANSSSPPSNSGTSSTTPATSTTAPTTSSGVGTPLFPVALGDTWVYTDKLLTSEHGTSTNKIVGVTPIAGGHRVKLQISTDVDGTPSTTTLSYIFHSDGSITVPFQQVGSSDVTIKSGAIVWPSQAELNSGQPHTSNLVVDIHTSSLSETVKAKILVQGLGTHTVTVPAGTYSATLVNETITEKVEGITVSIGVKTWLAPGVGPVKSEVVSTELGSTKPSAIDELKSFTKG